jgi:hypothetical protein
MLQKLIHSIRLTSEFFPQGRELFMEASFQLVRGRSLVGAPLTPQDRQDS